MTGAPGSRAGSMFGPYRLKRPLGRGGMGEVYEAEHTIKGWTVAVKLMSETVSKDPVFRERMKCEARIASRLQEPHVVPIHDYGEIDGQLFLAMRLIEGTDLDSLLTRFGPLTPPRAVAIISQIASALDAAHADEVMHRDVKPQNILITCDDFAYLVNFWIASATTDEKLTQLGTAVDTRKYMAPERFSNEEVTHRADIYALACVLYECLTGAPPYPSSNPGVLMRAHMMEPAPQPSAKRSDIPRAFDAVIARGMAKKPQHRYASAGDLAGAAHEALTSPDQNQAVNILRRSEESTLPGLKGAIQSVQHRRAPFADAANSGRMPRSSPAVPPTRAADSAPLRGANQPVNQPPSNPQYHQARSGWGGSAPSAPQQFAGPPPWGHRHQPPPPRKRNPWAIVAVAAAVVVVLVLVAIGIWMATRDDDNNSPNAGRTTTSIATTTKTSTSPSTPPPDAQNRLLSLLAFRLPARHLQVRGPTDAGLVGLREVRPKHRSQRSDSLGLRAVLRSASLAGRLHRLQRK